MKKGIGEHEPNLNVYVKSLVTHVAIIGSCPPDMTYNGSTTTCDALWMGVPMVTCPGDTFSSRHSLANLSSVGLTETIVSDLAQYVERAVSLAEDIPHLAVLRARLRPQMAASPLCDGSRFAAHFMRLLREVWRKWCSSEGPLHCKTAAKP